ncbi:MAG: phosphotransferase [Anaerolineae bacterium]|nr:phosphotransferase [Anaerolineae bacterium]
MNDHYRLDHYLAAWQLSDPHFLAQTATSHIYTMTHGAQTVVLKLLSPTETEEQTGALALRHFAGHGAVHLLRYDEGAHLLEYADGDELVTLVERGDDEGATRIIAEVLNQLHSAPQDGPHDGLFTLERWFRSLFRRAAAEQQAGVASIFGRGAALAERLLADPRDVRVLHGDIHHRNIRRSARGWLAFDPKGLVGERTYDCANTLCNPYPLTALVHNEARLMRNAAILASALDLELARLLAYAFAYMCLSASWFLDDGSSDGARWALGVAALIEPHIVGMIG